MIRPKLNYANEVRRIRSLHRNKWKAKKGRWAARWYAPYEPTDFSDDLHINRAALMFGMVDQVINEPKPDQ